MIKLQKIFPLIILSVFFIITSCKKNENKNNLADVEVHEEDKVIPIDTTKFDVFFKTYPLFKAYEKEIKELYKKHDHFIWQDKDGFIEFAQVLYNQTHQLDEEGVKMDMPYNDVISNIFYSDTKKEPELDTELLISSMYFYYTSKVYAGLDEEASKETGWYLPRERTSYIAYLDTLMIDPQLIKEDKSEFFKQYYNLKKGLKKYRNIEEKGGWGTITLEKGVVIKPGDSATAVAQLRERLYKEGYLKDNNENNIYDEELVSAVSNYNTKHNREGENNITSSLVKELNISVEERIKTISVNMERCRWITPKINTAKEYIAVNIPSYRLHYFQDGKPELISRVVVGKELNKTVVFSGEMSYIAFSPYWNIPKSILENEIKPKIAKDDNYLAKHNMEWVGNRVRQKPGGNNSLGLVKFMFPNSNNIYLHDTPAKSLFNKDERAFSHGCVRVEKARELAIAITKKHGDWNEDKVDKAMHASKENIFNIKDKIPVYIAYFTAWADKDGNVAFYDDIYNRDERLAHLLYKS
ncbi:L,D-transpeptidase [Flavobacterium arcticum]|uniref:L,D-transpeptidase n=2 Tax=Flavobacterium arcticum TaxID=1784713 RepID=A0A345HFB4_9FLAO|nr:L,D-transpeptidase [Flavobacterium arcticum]KAF2512494.1 L,D-transpeptidase family protein [Flavobacterium arcticum]